MGGLTRKAPFIESDACRSCGTKNLFSLMPFGDTPIADRLVQPEDQTPEFVAPLTLALCGECGLCQIVETIEPTVLFGVDYPYYSSVSPALLSHFRTSAEELIRHMDLGPDDLVIEPASNDGYMLSTFFKAGVQVLGIDPAAGPVKAARQRGVETIHDFFSYALAKELVAKGRKAQLVLANNVLAHVADPKGFIQGIAALLSDEGRAVFEFPYLVDLVEKRAFDTIYHQHLLYLSATSAMALLEANGLQLNDVERTQVHGGSLRITASKHPGRTEALNAMLTAEEEMEISHPNYFRSFTLGIEKMKLDTRHAIAKLKDEGKTVIGYGAAAKSTTLLHHFGLKKSDISCIIDKSPQKLGLEMPVTRIPVVSKEVLELDQPDAVLILAWNFAREIIAENAAYIENGGVFLAPVPEFRTVTAADAGASL